MSFWDRLVTHPGRRAAVKREPVTVTSLPANVTTVSSRLGAPDIRMFNVKAINDQIDRHVSILKPKEKIVATGYIDTEGAHVAVVGKVDALPGDFKWTVLHVEKWGGGRETSAAFRWGF